MTGFLTGLNGYYRRTVDKYNRVNKHGDADVTQTFLDMTGSVRDASHPLLPSNASSVVLEFSAIKHATIQMMAELPAEMNTEIAEIVRARVKAVDWPNGIEASNAIIKALIMERVAKPR